MLYFKNLFVLFHEILLVPIYSSYILKYIPKKTIYKSSMNKETIHLCIFEYESPYHLKNEFNRKEIVVEGRFVFFFFK